MDLKQPTRVPQSGIRSVWKSN